MDRSSSNQPNDMPTRKAPSVSVIIPSYNTAAYIAEALDSVFAQTFTDFEVIVVNDGSPDADELEAALAPFAARTQFISEGNRGASAARNAGIGVARGNYIALLDADDRWAPDFLERQVGYLE